MLINIVSMNIIFGIIIDTFAELRDAQNTRDEDLKNVCFISGYERDVFEKQGKLISMTYISLVIDIKSIWCRKSEVLRWKIDFFMCNCLKNGVRGRCILCTF